MTQIFRDKMPVWEWIERVHSSAHFLDCTKLNQEAGYDKAIKSHSVQGFLRDPYFIYEQGYFITANVPNMGAVSGFTLYHVEPTKYNAVCHFRYDPENLLFDQIKITKIISKNSPDEDQLAQQIQRLLSNPKNSIVKAEYRCVSGVNAGANIDDNDNDNIQDLQGAMR